MMLYYFVFSHFIPNDKILDPNECAIIIRGMGYKKDGQNGFISNSGSTRTIIRIQDSGVWIKAYGHGYGESDFLRFPIESKDELKKFIRENAV